MDRWRQWPIIQGGHGETWLWQLTEGTLLGNLVDLAGKTLIRTMDVAEGVFSFDAAHDSRGRVILLVESKRGRDHELKLITMDGGRMMQEHRLARLQGPLFSHFVPTEDLVSPAWLDQAIIRSADWEVPLPGSIATLKQLMPVAGGREWPWVFRADSVDDKVVAGFLGWRGWEPWEGSSAMTVLPPVGVDADDVHFAAAFPDAEEGVFIVHRKGRKLWGRRLWSKAKIVFNWADATPVGGAGALTGCGGKGFFWIDPVTSRCISGPLESSDGTVRETVVVSRDLDRLSLLPVRLRGGSCPIRGGGACYSHGWAAVEGGRISRLSVPARCPLSHIHIAPRRNKVSPTPSIPTPRKIAQIRSAHSDSRPSGGIPADKPVRARRSDPDRVSKLQRALRGALLELESLRKECEELRQKDHGDVRKNPR